jgi:hypothetical protein
MKRKMNFDEQSNGGGASGHRSSMNSKVGEPHAGRKTRILIVEDEPAMVAGLGVGDVLMIYSDGITESLNDAGEEFGYARLESQLRRAQVSAADAVLEMQQHCAQASAANAVLFSVLGAVQDFAATCPLVDDMSLAIVRRDRL